MIAQLMRREPLWIVGVGVVAAVLWGGLIPAEMRQPTAIGFLMVIMLASRGNRRATLFEAALPIPGRTLIAARFLFILAAIWLPTGCAVAMLMANGQAANAGDLCGSATVLTAAIVFAMTSRIEEFGSSTPSAPFLIGAVIAMTLPEIWTGHAAIVCAVAGLPAAGRLATVWPRIPAGFQAAPFEPRRARIERQTRLHGGWVGMLPLMRAALPRPVWPLLALVAVQALIGSAIYGAVAGFGIPAMPRRAGRWLWAMPLSRPTLLAITALPFLLCVGGSFALGAWLRPFHRESGMPVSMYDDGARYVELWRVARGGETPVIQAPWGETVHPAGMPVLGWVVYNPFVVAPRSSPQFVEWQFQRATEAIYGRAIPTAEYRKLPWTALRPLSLQWRAGVLSTALMLGIAMLGVFSVTIYEWRPFGRLSKAWRTTFGTVAMVLAFGPVLALDFVGLGGPIHVGSTGLVMMVALRLSAYPWLAVAIVSAGYAVLQWQFAGVEPAKQAVTIGSRLIDERGI